MYRGSGAPGPPGGPAPWMPVPDERIAGGGAGYRPVMGMGEGLLDPYGGSGGGSGMAGGYDPVTAGLLGLRGAGGTGGGSAATEGNMDANELIALSEFLGENVTSFAYGGKVRDPYRYDAGGVYQNYEGATHTMPDGTVHPGATHEDYMAMMGEVSSPYMANKGMKRRYAGGGSYEDLANQLVAVRQIDNIARADYGMKMKRKRYTQGGRF